MPNWNDLLNEIQEAGSTYDIIRRNQLKKMHEKTKRNIIIYYSGWLQKPNMSGMGINDEDKNGFMTVIHGMETSIGLDLILHTPGGEMAAVESLIKYIRSIFGTDVRAFIPQLAMSGGTMIACACNEIFMGKQSSLGPIDPLLNGIPAHGVVEEFNQAKREVISNPGITPIWQQMIAKYGPAFVGECEKAIAWSNEMTAELLETGMFAGSKNNQSTIDNIIEELGNHALTKSHSRHLSADQCIKMGLKVSNLEDDNELQDGILSLHHACMHTLSSTPAIKIIENHNGTAFIKAALPQRIMPGS